MQFALLLLLWCSLAILHGISAIAPKYRFLRKEVKKETIQSKLNNFKALKERRVTIMKYVKFISYTFVAICILLLSGIVTRPVHAAICGGTPCVDSADIINGSIVAGDVSGTIQMPGTNITNNTVQSIDIQDSTITSIDIAADTITAADIAADAVGSSEIAAGAVGASEIADGSVGAAEIATDAVGSSEIAANAVGALEIAAGAVGTSEIADGSVTATDLSNESGADYTNLDALTALTSVDDVIISVSISAPSSGHVIVNASGYFNSTADGSIGRCSITTGVTVDFSVLIISDLNATNNYAPFASTRGFPVLAGLNVFNLVCNEFSGAMSVGDPSMIAIFVPTVY